MTTSISPTLGHGVLDTQAGVGTTPGYDAIDRRRSFHGYERGEGVTTYGSYRVSQRGAGTNMSVDINMDVGVYVRGDAVTLQGLYFVPPHTATINETISTADATNPRIDRVILEVKDNTHDASGSNLAQTRVITGTPTGGATLDNLTGAGAVPSSAMLLADVLVAATDTAISDSEIRDRRPFLTGIPPLLTDVDMVEMLPFGAPISSGAATVAISTTNDLHQSAALFYLPRRIASATRIRWRYQQDSATALTGSYVIGIFDSSGRKIVDTGTVAFTGGTSTIQARSETITATTFEPGAYYVFIGVDTTAGVSIVFSGVLATYTYAPNTVLRVTSGGLTVPNTLLAFTDATTISPAAAVPGIPSIALSVG